MYLDNPEGLVEVESSLIGGNYSGNYVKSKLFPCSGFAAMRQVNPTHKKKPWSLKFLKTVFQKSFIAMVILKNWKPELSYI